LRNSDILMPLFNSLMSRETSLLFEINSLFPILGNLEEKHRWLLRFLVGQTSNQTLKSINSLYFPGRSGNLTRRLVRTRLQHPPTSPDSRDSSLQFSDGGAIPGRYFRQRGPETPRKPKLQPEFRDLSLSRDRSVPVAPFRFQRARRFSANGRRCESLWGA
jgi:hypothetical protein